LETSLSRQSTALVLTTRNQGTESHYTDPKQKRQTEKKPVLGTKKLSLALVHLLGSQVKKCSGPYSYNLRAITGHQGKQFCYK